MGDFPLSLLDNVIFDQNSFDSVSDVVTLKGARIVTNPDGTGVIPVTKLETPNGNNSLTIVEVLNAGDMVIDLNELSFSGSTASSINSYSGAFSFRCPSNAAVPLQATCMNCQHLR